MKKKFVYLLAATLLAAAPAVTLTSCGDDDPTTDATGGNGGTTDGGSTDGGTTTGKLTPDEQKAKFETVGKEFINEFSASNFTELSDLCAYADDEYVNNPSYDHSAIRSWFEAALDACTEFDFADKRANSYEDWNGVHINYYTTNYYQRLIELSCFTGHFTAGEKGWTQTSTDTSDLQFSFTDENGNPCTLTVAHSGNTVIIPLGEEEGDYEYLPKDNDFYTTTDIYDNNVEVPENIEVTLTQNGKTMAHVALKSDLSSLQGEDFSKMSISTALTCELCGYTIQLNRLAYSAETGNGEVSVSLTKGNKALLAGSLTVNNLKFDFDNMNVESGDGVKISFEVLGQVRIEGVCDNISDVAEYLQNCDAHKYDETNFKANLGFANEFLHFGSYFVGNPTKQTDVILGAKFCETPWASSERGYWTCEPLLKFDDNTTYAFGDYFNETSFKAVIDSFNDLLKSFQDLAK